MYSNYTFNELNEQLKSSTTLPDEDFLSALIVKGLQAAELFVAKLARDYKITISNEDVYEIINSVLENITKYYDIKKNRDFKAYLFLTAKGKLLNYFRDTTFLKKEFSYNETNEDDEEFISSFADTNITENIDDLIQLKTAFKAIDEKCQRALYLRKVLEYSIQEIMSSMKIKTMTEEAFRQQISYCLKKLKELFNGLK